MMETSSKESIEEQREAAENSPTSLKHDGGHVPTINDRDEFSMEDSGKSDDIESILTPKTPQVPPDQAIVTPQVTLTQLTSAVSHEPPTPVIKSTGRESRMNSTNLMLELEQVALITLQDNCEENQPPSNCSDDEILPESEVEDTSAGTMYLNNILELHYLHQTRSGNRNKCCVYPDELEKTVDKQKRTIDELLYEKKELEAKMENSGRQLFHKEQKIKILSDRVKQLEDTHSYRKEVERLQAIVEQGEVESKMLGEDFKRLQEVYTEALEEKQKMKNELEGRLQKEVNISKELEERNKKIGEMKEELNSIQEKMIILEDNKSYLLDENVQLKNEAKVLKQKVRPDEICPSPGKETNEVQEKDINKEMNMELKSLKKELENFKRFTFKKFDELTGRGGSSSSSLSSTSCDDTELLGGEMSEGEREQQQPPQSKKKLSPAVTLRFEGNGPPTAALSPDEAGHTVPLVPGPETYSQKVRGSTNSPESSDYDAEEKARKIAGIRSRRQTRESKSLIFSSSITRDITRQHRSFNEKCVKSEVVIHEFKGKRASDIVKYMLPHLEEEQPSTVVFVAGGNDLPNRDISTDEIKKVANCLVEGGLLCRDIYGVNEVCISSIMPRSHSVFQGNRHRLNNILKDMCRERNFTFIDHSNIILSTHGHHDGVHLNSEGSDLLRDNLLNVLNS